MATKPIEHLLADIIAELRKIQSTPTLARDATDDFPLPRMLPVDQESGIVISKKIETAIAEVSRRLLENHPDRKETHTQAEWTVVVRRSFGPALITIDLDLPLDEASKQLHALLKASLETEQSQLIAREHAFGCTLFSNANIEPLRIGPVLFEVRKEWLARQATARNVTDVTARRVERLWSGQAIRKRKLSNDSLREDDIVSAISGCPFVCSVETSGFSDEAAKARALTAARLALASVSLLWQTPSRALDGFNLLYDRSPRRLKTLTFIPGKIVLAGSSLSHMPHGPFIEPEKWRLLHRRHRACFDVVAEMLNFFLSPTGDVSRPNLMNTLLQALLWFHEGCREQVDLMAIVKFSASMDALACGGKARGIRNLIAARVGLDEERPIRPGGPTVKQVIDYIYADGRSRTVHGTNSQLGRDWTDTKGLAEQFARLCLMASIEWMGKNPSKDAPRDLVKS